MSIIRRLLGTATSAPITQDRLNYNALIERGFLLVDVRTTEEYSSGNIPKSINIPLSDLKSKLTYFSESNRPIVFYCKSGRRAAKAEQAVRAHHIECYNGGGIKTLHPILQRHQYGVREIVDTPINFAPVVPVKRAQMS